MQRAHHLVGIVCLAVFPQVALALGIPPNPCQFAGYATLTPAQPTTDDRIGISLNVPVSNIVESFPVYDYYWVKVTATDATTFAVDLIQTNDATATFAGYTLVGKNLSAWVFIGPLPGGFYTILGTVNVYDPVSGTVRPECDPMFGSSRETSLNVYPSDSDFGSKGAGPIAEFYNSSIDQYFLTANFYEAAWLDAGYIPGWQRTGQTFLAYFPGIQGPYSVLRFYGLPSAGLNSHFFTFSNAESASLSPNDWVFEGVAFEAWHPFPETGLCPPGTFPVYRLWNGKANAGHRYTVDAGVRLDMIAKGWIPEGYGPDGVVMCVPPQ